MTSNPTLPIKTNQNQIKPTNEMLHPRSTNRHKTDLPLVKLDCWRWGRASPSSWTRSSTRPTKSQMNQIRSREIKQMRPGIWLRRLTSVRALWVSVRAVMALGSRVWLSSKTRLELSTVIAFWVSPINQQNPRCSVGGFVHCRWRLFHWRICPVAEGALHPLNYEIFSIRTHS